ncbi:MAG: class I SAM-dependent methyltransferase [Thermodesulfobacteriota bacterium]|nr:class I SAM-dependent methyltransferase [Thermodesulfobacteriota bacterium]
MGGVNVFESFLRNNNQKNRTAGLLSQRLLETSSFRDKLLQNNRIDILDIGCGSGELTIPLLNNLLKGNKKTTIHLDILDLNEVMIRSFIANAKGAAFEIANSYACSWEDFTPNKKYDYILCSHSCYSILSLRYHETIEKYSYYFKKMFDALADGGILSIIVSSSSLSNQKFKFEYQFYSAIFGDGVTPSGGANVFSALEYLSVNFFVNYVHFVQDVSSLKAAIEGKEDEDLRNWISYLLLTPFNQIQKNIQKEIYLFLSNEGKTSLPNIFNEGLTDGLANNYADLLLYFIDDVFWIMK